MFEESVSAIPSSSSLWASMNSWFTPSVFFVLLNVMIGTIAYTSSLAANNQNKNPQIDPHTPNPNPNSARSTISILQRLKSINFYGSHQEEHQNSKSDADSDTLFNIGTETETTQSSAHYFFTQETTQESPVLEHSAQEVQTQFVFQQQDLILDDSGEGNDEGNGMGTMDEVYSQLKIGKNKSDGPKIEMPPAKKIGKSASLKPGIGRNFEQEKSVEARRPATVREKGAKATEGDEGVDAKADDFINKFKQQLKLQRVDSIARYQEKVRR